MTEILGATLALYRDAFRATVRSMTRSWMIAVALVGFGAVLVVATIIATPLGMAGGFLLGAVNAALFGALLSLIEQAVMASRQVVLADVRNSIGQYFWDVLGVGFVLWVPSLLLERGLAGNPHGPFLTAAVFLLLFTLLNPAPEVIYQVRHGSPLDVIRQSYEFVIENWVEWFLPLAIAVAPLGLSFFVAMSSRLGADAGLNFFQLLILPFTLLIAWLNFLGLPQVAGWWLVVLLTPPLTVAMLVFRGHLFAALYGTSRRLRLFQRRAGEDL